MGKMADISISGIKDSYLKQVAQKVDEAGNKNGQLEETEKQAFLDAVKAEKGAKFLEQIVFAENNVSIKDKAGETFAWVVVGSISLVWGVSIADGIYMNSLKPKVPELHACPNKIKYGQDQLKLSYKNNNVVKVLISRSEGAALWFANTEPSDWVYDTRYVGGYVYSVPDPVLDDLRSGTYEVTIFVKGERRIADEVSFEFIR
jgi:hypothetical protein